jgi:hypothetical protein
MSANRSVQAAQRRRSGAPEQQRPAPQPSINSAQMFANQSRSGSGPNMNPGRLSAQQLNMPQQQSNESLSSVNKMTIPQAITLITLRLGAVESKLLNYTESQSGNMMSMDMEVNENMVLLDKSVIQSIDNRLESLEKRNTGSLNQEVLLVKQQFDTIKQTIVQTKNATVAVVKENKDLKTQIDVLKQELSETKDLLLILQNLTMDNNQKILSLSMGANFDTDFDTNNFTNLEDLQDGLQQDIHHDSDSENEYENDNENKLVGTNLKQLIESEINADINADI